MKWEPIATAPMDETEVLVAVSVAGTLIVRNARYVKAASWPDADADDRDGWWAYRNSVGQELLDGLFAPTHWAPMPEGATC